ncbi:ribokinase [Pontibacter locisalis]|uniref:Ribokinase n=1 Tax=Pontibacter locisalis TaxID=1719035 RepID=A0ABW5IQG1_9BACT
MTQGIIISLGSINADFQVRVDKDPYQTTTMIGHDLQRLGGGKGANVAYQAHLLGASATLIGRVGNDDLKEQALKPLREMDIDLTYVRAVDGASTAVSMIAVPPNGKKKIILAPNANDVWVEEDKDEVRKAILQAPEGSVLVADYEVAPAIVEVAINAAQEKNFTVILDPSPTDRVDKRLFEKINYLIPDASETEGLTGTAPASLEKAVSAAHKLLDQGVKNVLVKLEGGGCIAANKEITFHIPAIPVEVVDTTGAGDAFAGALAVAVMEKRPLKEAACFASAASLVAVTGFGSQPAYASRERVEHYFDLTIDKIEEI